MKSKTHQLYCLYVVQTGKVFYVGVTNKKLSYRLREHLGDVKRKRSPKKCSKILSEQRKGHTIEILPLLSFDTLEEVHEAEKKYIAWCRSIGIELTNCTDGGEGTVGFEWTPSMRERRSRENAFRDVHGSAHPTSLAVDQLDLDGNLIKRWENQTEAANALGLHKQGISKCCNGTLKQSGGFVWRYVHGKRKNHPKSFKEIDVHYVLAELAKGRTKTEIAQELGVQRHTLSRRLK